MKSSKKNSTNSWNKKASLFLLCASSALAAPVPQSHHKDLERSLNVLKNSGNLTQAIFSLKARDASLEQSLTEMVLDPAKDLKERWFAVMAVTKLQGSQALGNLKKWAEHPEWFVRLASLKALSYLDLNESTYPTSLVMKRLKDKSILVRDGALEVLGRWCLPQTQSKILGVIDDQEHFRKKHPLFIRKRAVDVIGQCGFSSVETKKRLVQLFEEENFYDIHSATHQTLQLLTQRKLPFMNDGKKLFTQWSRNLAAN